MKDYKKILSRGVDDQNRTTFTIEHDDGSAETVLYSELDQSRVRSDFLEKKERLFTKIIHFQDGTRSVIRSHDATGARVDIKEEEKRVKDEFAKKKSL